MKNRGGQFEPELGGHFQPKSGGHFKSELGGQFDRNLQVTIDLNTNLTNPSNVDFDYIERYTSSVTTKQFFNPITNNYYIENYITNNIQEITLLLYKTIYKNYALSNYLLFEGFLEVFYKHFEIIHHFDYTQNPNYGGTDFYYKNYTEAYFGILRVRLIEFYFWSKSINVYSDVSEKKHDLIIRIVSLFHDFELSVLDYTVKENLLKKFLNDNPRIMGKWNLFFEGTLLSEEEVVIKIVKSFIKVNEDGTLNHGEINKFMDILNSKDFFKFEEKTLYEYLYDKIDPDVIFGGAGNRGKFVDAVYQLWLNSKYNPKADLGSIANFQYHYTEFNALIYDADLDDYTTDTTAAPLSMPYESEKRWLWNDNNFKFIFKNNKIIAAQEKEKSIGLLFPNLNNLYELLFEEIPNHIAYGYYHIFQPVDLTTIGDTVIKVPYDFNLLPNLGENFNPCNIESTGRGSNLPIFYLKFIDDIAQRKNNEETILIAIDVLSIAVGGWGIYRRMIAEGAKIAMRDVAEKVLMHGLQNALNNPSLISNAVKNNLLKVFKSAIKSNGFNILEVVFGSASIVNNIVNSNCTIYNNCDSEPPQPPGNNATNEEIENYSAYQYCMALQKWLFALEILSLSGDAIARNFFKKTTKEVREFLPPIKPSSFDNISDTAYLDLKDYLSLIDQLDDFLTPFVNSISNVNVRNKVNLLTPEKKYAFMFDFDKRASELANLEGDIVDRWSLLLDLKAVDRKNLNIITSAEQTSKLSRYYEHDGLFTILENFSFDKRWRFLNEMGDVSIPNFNKFVSENTLIDKWFRYYDDAVLQGVFKNLGEDNMLKFIERYGDISEGAFRNLKAKAAKVFLPQKFEYLLEFPDATHNFAYFNKRRAEMLPPGFEDLAKKNFYGTQEVDSFIELELLSGGKARPSLPNEAGDIIMEGGSLHGLSLDPFSPPYDVFDHIQNQGYNKWLGRLQNDTLKGKGFLGAISTHFRKIHTPQIGKPSLDKVVIDYKYFDQVSIAIGESNPNYFKNYVDNILNTHFSQYSSQIIKLNY